MVSCTDCRYCMPRPVGVDIPQNFTHLNNISMYNDVASVKYHYNMFVRGKSKGALNCMECGKCEETCPQNIEIRKMLKEVVNTFGE